MIVRCTQCNSAFSVDDDKVEAKRFAFTCPNCSAENVIDNRKDIPETVEEPVSGDFITEGGDFITSPDDFEQESRGDSGPGLSEDAAAGAQENMETGLPGQEEFSLDDIDLSEADDILLDGTDSDNETVQAGADNTDDLIDTDINGLMDIVDIDEGAKREGGSVYGDDLPGAGEETAVSAGRETTQDDFEDIDLGDIGAEMQDMMEEEAGTPAQGAVDDPGLVQDIDLGEPIMDMTEEDLPEPVMAAEDLSTEGGGRFEIETDADFITEEVPDITGLEPFEAETGAVTRKDKSDIAIESEVSSEELYSREGDDEDESITIDLDTLDIELEEGDEENVPARALPEEDIDIDLGEPEITVSADLSAAEDEVEDEAITLDLDSLDIELAEDETIREGEKPDDLMEGVSYIEDEIPAEIPAGMDESLLSEEDEDITLDLDSLDIPLAESEEIKQGEELDDDEKLTLEDAGLTLDELTVEEQVSVASVEEPEEDIKLTIDEIDPTLDLDAIESETPGTEDLDTVLSGTDELIIEDEEPLPGPDLVEPDAHGRDELIINDVDELPEIDIDEYFENELPGEAAAVVPDDLEEMIEIDTSGSPYDYEEYDDLEDSQRKLPDMVPGGSVNFSIDYSLKYSRIGAFVRLVCLYLIGLLPHFLVFMVYTLLSLVLGMINHVVVMFTGEVVEDFAEIQEKTLRYFLSINVSAIGIVEEMPVFTGRKDIDYALQMDVTYPLRHSRILALMRLTVAGIFLVTLPHLLILVVLNLVIPIFYLAGIISILLTARWPHFLFDFLTKYFRYLSRVLAFMIGLVDVYPPFTFE